MAWVATIKFETRRPRKLVRRLETGAPCPERHWLNGYAARGDRDLVITSIRTAGQRCVEVDIEEVVL